MSMVKLFVHGILRGEGCPAKLYNYERFMRGFSTIKKKEGCITTGELLVLTKEELDQFDIVEGVVHDYYHRFMIRCVTDEDGVVHDAWVYQQVVDKDIKDSMLGVGD